MRLETKQFDAGGRAFPGWRLLVTEGRGIATPAVSNDHVIFGGGFGSHDVYSVDARTGSLRWNVRTGDDGPTAATVIGDIALFNTESCTPRLSVAIPPSRNAEQSPSLYRLIQAFAPHTPDLTTAMEPAPPT